MADPEIPEQPPQPDDTQGVRGKRKAAVFGGIGAGVVALVVLLSIVLSGGGGSGSADRQNTGSSAALAWSKASLGAGISGTWVSGGELVVITSEALTAYEIASGKQDWSWPVPSGAKICRMSSTASSPRGAFIYGTGDGCGTLQVLDLATGKPIWSAPVNLAPAGDEDPSSNPVGLSIQGSYLVAPYGKRDIVDIDLSTGRSVWTTNQNAPDQVCTIESAVMVGTDVYYGTTGDCDHGDQIWKRDAASAAPATAMSLPITCDKPALLQAGSALAAVCGNATLLLAPPGSSSLITVKATGLALEQIATDTRFAQPMLAHAAVYGNTLYLADTPDNSGLNGITAVDLSSGNTLWTAPFSYTEQFRVVAGATSAGVVFWYWNPGHDAYAIRTLAASSGALSTETAIDTRAQETPETGLLAGDYLIGISSYPVDGNDQLAVYHLS